MSQPPRTQSDTTSRLALVVVLGGGDSRRLGHDKLAASIGGRSLLDTLLAGLVANLPGVQVAVVGPERATQLPVTWCREEPAGGGPVAGLAVALALAPAADPRAVVALVAGDQPFAAPALPQLVSALDAALLAAPGRRDDSIGVDGAIGVDPAGRDQPLLAAYLAGPLRHAVGAHPAGQSMRSVLSRLSVVRLPLEGQWCLDVDTAADLDAARRVARLGFEP